MNDSLKQLTMDEWVAGEEGQITFRCTVCGVENTWTCYSVPSLIGQERMESSRRVREAYRAMGGRCIDHYYGKMPGDKEFLAMAQRMVGR